MTKFSTHSVVGVASKQARCVDYAVGGHRYGSVTVNERCGWAIIMASGDPAPSAADIQAPRMLRQAAKVLEIDLAEHVIVGDPKADPNGTGYYSFKTAGLI